MEKTYDNELENTNDNRCRIETHEINEHAGAHTREEPSQSTERRPQSSNKTMHGRIVRISSIPKDHYGGHAIFTRTSRPAQSFPRHQVELTRKMHQFYLHSLVESIDYTRDLLPTNAYSVEAQRRYYQRQRPKMKMD